MRPEYVTLLTVTVSLIGSIGVAFITGYFSRKASTDAIDKEHRINHNKEKEREKRELTKLYISVIKADYENDMVIFHPNGFAELENDIYKETVRDMIYDKYHLIHDTVIKHFNKIEETNQKISNYEMYSDNSDLQLDIHVVADSYILMIEEIKKIVNKQRAKALY